MPFGRESLQIKVPVNIKKRKNLFLKLNIYKLYVLYYIKEQ